MRSLLIIKLQPLIDVFLKFLDAVIDLFAERDLVELFKDRAVESLTNTIGLRRLGLGTAVVNILNRQIQLVFVVGHVATVFSPPVGEDAQEAHVMGFK